MTYSMPMKNLSERADWSRPVLVPLAASDRAANGGTKAYIEDGNSGTYLS